MLPVRLQPLLMIGALLLAPLALAERVRVPMTLDAPALESLLRARLFTNRGGTLRLNDDGTGCQYLELREPAVRISGGRILVRANAEARSMVSASAVLSTRSGLIGASRRRSAPPRRESRARALAMLSASAA